MISSGSCEARTETRLEIKTQNSRLKTAPNSSSDGSGVWHSFEFESCAEERKAGSAGVREAKCPI